MPFEMKWQDRKKKQIPNNAMVWVWNETSQQTSAVCDPEASKLPGSYTHWQYVVRVKPYGPEGKPLDPGKIWIRDMAIECVDRYEQRIRKAKAEGIKVDDNGYPV